MKNNIEILTNKLNELVQLSSELKTRRDDIDSKRASNYSEIEKLKTKLSKLKISEYKKLYKKKLDTSLGKNLVYVNTFIDNNHNIGYIEDPINKNYNEDHYDIIKLTKVTSYDINAYYNRSDNEINISIDICCEKSHEYSHYFNDDHIEINSIEVSKNFKLGIYSNNPLDNLFINNDTPQIYLDKIKEIKKNCR